MNNSHRNIYAMASEQVNEASKEAQPLPNHVSPGVESLLYSAGPFVPLPYQTANLAESSYPDPSCFGMNMTSSQGIDSRPGAPSRNPSLLLSGTCDEKQNLTCIHGDKQIEAEGVSKQSSFPSLAETAIASETSIDLKKPKRCLTAYNIYFRDTRRKILSSLPTSDEVMNNKKNRRGHRNRRPVHGKISFAALGREIASKWKLTPHEERRYYYEMARQDKERYVNEMEVWKRREIQRKKELKRTEKATLKSKTPKFCQEKKESSVCSIPSSPLQQPPPTLHQHTCKTPPIVDGVSVSAHKKQLMSRGELNYALPTPPALFNPCQNEMLKRIVSLESSSVVPLSPACSGGVMVPAGTVSRTVKPLLRHREVLLPSLNQIYMPEMPDRIGQLTYKEPGTTSASVCDRASVPDCSLIHLAACAGQSSAMLPSCLFDHVSLFPMSPHPGTFGPEHHQEQVAPNGGVTTTTTTASKLFLEDFHHLDNIFQDDNKDENEEVVPAVFENQKVYDIDDCDYGFYEDLFSDDDDCLPTDKNNNIVPPPKQSCLPPQQSWL